MLSAVSLEQRDTAEGASLATMNMSEMLAAQLPWSPVTCSCSVGCLRRMCCIQKGQNRVQFLRWLLRSLFNGGGVHRGKVQGPAQAGHRLADAALAACAAAARAARLPAVGDEAGMPCRAQSRMNLSFEGWSVLFVAFRQCAAHAGGKLGARRHAAGPTPHVGGQSCARVVVARHKISQRLQQPGGV